MDNRPSDESLLLAVAERDMGAFRTLYERHAGWLAIRLARRCNDRDLMADAIGDTYVSPLTLVTDPSLVADDQSMIRAACQTTGHVNGKLPS